MKQNSSILFHPMLKSLIKSYLHRGMWTVPFLFLWFFSIVSPIRTQGTDAAPEYLQSFDPAKGFKPAQRDLTEVFLQLAGSLEAYGSPEPYLRHVASEHARIEALYRQKFGKDPKSYRPAYMTDEYIDRLAANWKLLAPKLGLEPFAKNVGNAMRDAILGTRGTGTIIVDIFNRHQTRVFDQMAGKANQGADFEALRLDLVNALNSTKPPSTRKATRWPAATPSHSRSGFTAAP